ncbi:MAG: purine-binding chemotaxis protein CheW [Actinomycetota bacterium]|nr:purine-binding chemotaxis protein CheW [Actinomycetota bacterium]
MRVLLLPVGDETYAVELTALRSVVGDPQVFLIPTAPPAVLGALNLRGEIVVLLDTARILGVGTLGALGFAAVVDHPYGTVALAGEGRPQTALLGQPVAAGDLHGAVGSFAVGSAVVTLVDPAVLVVPAAP